MTTLHRHVDLETVEQLANLPDGSILHRPRGWAHPGLTGSVVRWPQRLTPSYRVGVDFWPASRVLATFAGALVPMEAEAVRSEFTGIGFATERRAGGPFTAYYVHERTA